MEEIMNYKNSELITWSDTFSCGLKVIDDQHKELVKLLNKMFNHVTGDEARERDYFNKIIQEAVEYIKVHFSTEEKIMKATQFSGYAEHKKIHDSFILTVNENIVGFNSGKRLSLFSFTNFVKNWILSHIAVMDKQYFYHLKKTATRTADGKLSITTADIHPAVHAYADISGKTIPESA